MLFTYALPVDLVRVPAAPSVQQFVPPTLLYRSWVVLGLGSWVVLGESWVVLEVRQLRHPLQSHETPQYALQSKLGTETLFLMKNPIL